ncbi:hypothetical protein OG462_34920 [Streptomyces sp. NBC_01077]|uniref:hypothetical protein n=1 Tax=Streptomyces sp. NBC_01077 TaxID=2903746 RepID=UPI003865D325|nr:hypothetical protein OG462_34920 [Streptomyces sp. NBC_01077]
MSPTLEPTVTPATPAGLPARARPGHRGRRPVPGRRLWIVLLLVLAALLGTGASGTLTGGAELRPAASPASDPSGEIHDSAATEAGLPGRPRRHRTGRRPVRPLRLPYGARRHRRTPAPVPAARGDALRCVVMRC